MDTSKRRFIRLAIVTATAAGVALASPVVAVADESEVIEAAPIGENSDPPVVTMPTTEPLVIELIVEGDPPTDSTEPPEGAVSEEPAEPGALPTETDSEPIGAGPSPTIAALETGGGTSGSGGSGGSDGSGDTGGTGGTGGEHPGDTGGTGEEHPGDTGGTGGEHTGSGGTGDPYRMTFEVSWQLPDGSTIPVPNVEFDWREMFDLAAASATGGGKPTSAHCTYPAGSTDLVCEFQNPGKHASITDGMVVPRKQDATYTVTVDWPVSGWTIVGATIVGANPEEYSARDVCTGGGGGHSGGGGHDSGHGETLEAAALEETGSGCLHTVVMRQPALTPEPPAEPPAQNPPVSEVPAAAPPQSQTPAPPEAAPAPPAVEVLPVTVTPRALPATGNTATTTLMIGTIVLALGGCLFMLARRRNDLPLS